MDEYKEHLRRLALHDDAYLDALLSQDPSATRALSEKEVALARLAATIALDAPPSSHQHVVTLALAVGATSEEIVATLEAVTPVTGTARVVSSARKIALAVGYDVDAALEQLDP